MAIGVAVADSPLGPFKDARGSALVTDATTPGPYGWDDIDPTVFIDDDGTAWLAWGNPVLYLARLKPNMTELDGPIEKIALPNYTEGPWLSKRKGIYYMTYASMAHQNVWEHLSYATAPSPRGPWTYQRRHHRPGQEQLYHPSRPSSRLQGPVLPGLSQRRADPA